MIDVKKVPYKSIEVETEVGTQTISSGNKIRFVTEDNGELKQGVVTGFKGTKPEKVEVEFIPSDGKHKELWSILEMEDGSLRLSEEEKDEDKGGDNGEEE